MPTHYKSTKAQLIDLGKCHTPHSATTKDKGPLKSGKKSKLKLCLFVIKLICTYVKVFTGYEFLSLVTIGQSLIPDMLTFVCFLSTF